MRKIIFAFAAMAIFASCSKDNVNGGQATVRFHLTDAPGNYDSVWVDIQSIEVKDEAGWTTYAVAHPGQYNLMELTNGLDTLLVQINLNPGRLNQIRLILGSNNEVMVNGTVHPLQTPSAQQSGLKLNVQQELAAGVTYDFWLDFDAQRSIVATGGGGFILKPVIRVFTQATTGAIDGYVDPANAANFIYAILNTDTVGGMPDTTGYFLIPGLSAGNWDLDFIAAPGFTDQSVNNVPVVLGQTTRIDTVKF